MDVREPNSGTTSRAESGRSDGKVAHAVRLAKEGKVAEARALLRAAHAEQPDEAAPLRELAGLAFLEAEWHDAGRLASEALERDPGDSLTRRLLAGSRFLEGDVQSALESWNCLQEPRLDLAEVQGSDQIRYRTITDQLGFRHDGLVTSRSFRQAERRIREIPAVSQSRISLVPAPHGRARLEIVVSERPLFPRNPRSLMRIGARSAVTREFRASAASLTGNGELWTVRGRWSKERPLVALSLSIPNPGGRPGIWRIESMWERQSFLPRELVEGELAPSESPPRELARLASEADSTRIETERLVREERRRSSLSFSDWVLPDVRLSMGAALDRWGRAGRFVALQDEVEVRLARDRLAWTTWGSGWIPMRSGAASFTAASTGLEFESSGIERADSWRAHAGLHTASRQAPFSVWPGAAPSPFVSGDLPEAAPLRAHPRTQNDIVQAERMSRSRWSSGLEKRIFPWRLGFLRAGMAAFVDAAGPLGSRPGARWQVDSGVGLLIREFGTAETVRLDLAHGLRDGTWALSLSWHADRRNGSD